MDQREHNISDTCLGAQMVPYIRSLSRQTIGSALSPNGCLNRKASRPALVAFFMRCDKQNNSSHSSLGQIRAPLGDKVLVAAARLRHRVPLANLSHDCFHAPRQQTIQDETRPTLAITESWIIFASTTPQCLLKIVSPKSCEKLEREYNINRRPNDYARSCSHYHR